MENHRETVLLKPTRTSLGDEVDQPGVVVLVWNDPVETPLQALARMKRELEGREQGDLDELRDELSNALNQTREALDSVQSASSYAQGALDGADRARDYAETANNELSDAISALERASQHQAVAS